MQVGFTGRFTRITFQKIPIPHHELIYELIPLNLINADFGKHQEQKVALFKEFVYSFQKKATSRDVHPNGGVSVLSSVL